MINSYVISLKMRYKLTFNQVISSVPTPLHTSIEQSALITENKQFCGDLELNVNNSTIKIYNICHLNSIICEQFKLKLDALCEILKFGLPPKGIAGVLTSNLFNLDIGSIRIQINRNDENVKILFCHQYFTFEHDFTCHLCEIILGIMLDYVYYAVSLTNGGKVSSEIDELREENKRKLLMYESFKAPNIEDDLCASIMLGKSKEKVILEGIVDEESSIVESVEEVESITGDDLNSIWGLHVDTSECNAYGFSHGNSPAKSPCSSEKIRIKRNDESELFAISPTSSECVEVNHYEPEEIFDEIFDRFAILRKSVLSANINYTRVKNLENENQNLKLQLSNLSYQLSQCK